MRLPLIGANFIPSIARMSRMMVPLVHNITMLRLLCWRRREQEGGEGLGGQWLGSVTGGQVRLVAILLPPHLILYVQCAPPLQRPACIASLDACLVSLTAFTHTPTHTNTHSH